MCATINAIDQRWSKAATHGVPLCHKFLQPWTDTDGRVRHVEWPKNFAAHKIGVRRSRNAGDDFVQDLVSEIGVVVSFAGRPEQNAITLNRFVDRKVLAEIEGCEARGVVSNTAH